MDLSVVGLGEVLPVALRALVEDVGPDGVPAFALEHARERLGGAQRQDQRSVAGAEQQFAGAYALHAALAFVAIEGVVDGAHDGAPQSGVAREVVARHEAVKLGVLEGALEHRAVHLMLPVHALGSSVREPERPPFFLFSTLSLVNAWRS